MGRFYFLALLAVLFMVFGIFGSCGGDDDDDSSDDDDDDNSGDDDTAFDDGDDDDDSGDDDTAFDDDDDDDGLKWQNPPSEYYMAWNSAIGYCENLDFDGHDDWRLPTISELRSLIDGCEETELGGSCDVTDSCTDFFCFNDSCQGCEFLEGPGEGGAYWPDGMTGEISWVWSSSPVADDDNRAWGVNFSNGRVFNDSLGNVNYTRCVR